MSNLYMLVLHIFCAALLIAWPAQPVYAENALAISQNEVSLIKAEDLQHFLQNKKSPILLDVREQKEYDAGHIDGARLLPLNTLPERLAELPKEKAIVVYCKSGRRSAQAAAFLRASGYKNVASLSGGFQEWAALKDPKKNEIQVCAKLTGCQRK